MIMTVEISMYPIRDDYLQPIKDFIAKLNLYLDLIVVTTPTSTRIQGEYTQVMKALTDAMAASYESYGTSVFVTKFLPGYEAD